MGQQDGPHPGEGLGIPRLQYTALSDPDGAAHVQRPGLAVKVLPFEAAQFSPAQAGGQLRVEEVVPEFVLVYGRHQRVQLVAVEDALGLLRHSGRCHLAGGVGRQKALFRRRLQRVVEGGVDAVDGCR